MGAVIKISASVVALAALVCLLHPCCAFAFSLYPAWSVAGAVWSIDGLLTEGDDACGYQQGAVFQPPFSSMIAAGNPPIFDGMGGACFQVKCTSHASCSNSPVTVVLTDEWPGEPSMNETVQFDLSWTAFGAMAKPGEADQLRAAGRLQVQYGEVPCHWQWLDIAFVVDNSSNPYFLAVFVDHESDAGDLSAVDLMQAPGPDKLHGFTPMQPNGDGEWMYNSTYYLRAPLSFRLTFSFSIERSSSPRTSFPSAGRPGSRTGRSSTTDRANWFNTSVSLIMFGSSCRRARNNHHQYRVSR